MLHAHALPKKILSRASATFPTAIRRQALPVIEPPKRSDRTIPGRFHKAALKLDACETFTFPAYRMNSNYGYSFVNRDSNLATNKEKYA